MLGVLVASPGEVTKPESLLEPASGDRTDFNRVHCPGSNSKERFAGSPTPSRMR